jgi:hypothetical protein
MGLDSVELVMAFEEAFGIEIPDVVASGMITPRRTIDYVESRLATVPADRCLTQQAFYRLRRGLHDVGGGAGLSIRPTTKVREIAEKREWHGLWTRIREAAGVPGWPDRVPWKGWLVEGPETLRELAVHIAMHLPPPDGSRGESWTRERIELTVRRSVWDIIRVKGFALDDQYVRDMGLD